MKIKDVITLKEVANDLNEGKDFYDQREVGVGDYFWDSLVADIESLVIYAGIHNKKKVAKKLEGSQTNRFPANLWFG
jgi:hypothetical protein